jgi:hypothetical protein
MYGLVFDCLEKYATKTFGILSWRDIIKKADVGVGIAKWVTNENYPDETFMKLATLLAFENDITFDRLVEELGVFFTTFIRYTEGKQTTCCYRAGTLLI